MVLVLGGPVRGRHPCHVRRPRAAARQPYAVVRASSKLPVGPQIVAQDSYHLLLTSIGEHGSSVSINGSVIDIVVILGCM
jgi:hypothetical protein